MSMTRIRMIMVRYYERVVEVVRKANPKAKILISLGGWADSAGDKYSR